MPVPFVNAEQATLFGTGSKPRERKSRAKDELFETLMFVTKTNAATLTASGRGMANRHLKELRDVGATPAEILKRAQVYRERWNSVPTSAALSRQWASLESSPLEARKVAPAPAHGVTAERRQEIAATLRAWQASR